jgi:hypothetical protein
LAALPRLLLALLPATLLLVGFLAALMLLVRLHPATLVLLVGFLAALMLLVRLHPPALLLAWPGIVLLTGILAGIARIGHSHLLLRFQMGSDDAPAPRGERPKIKRVRADDDQSCGAFP